MRQEACLLIGQPESDPIATAPIHLGRPLGAIACPTLAYRPNRYQPDFADAGVLAPMDPPGRNRHFIETPLLAVKKSDETPGQRAQRIANSKQRMIDDLEELHQNNPGQVAKGKSHTLDIPKDDKTV